MRTLQLVTSTQTLKQRIGGDLNERGNLAGIIVTDALVRFSKVLSIQN
jgi:hypothetical protein